MSIYKIHKRENPFVQIDKTLIFDEELSFKAKGILTYLLSRPNDWAVYEIEIVKHAKDGRDSVRSGIKELIEQGYIEREEKRNEKGQFEGYEYSVYETNNHVGKSDIGESDIGKPDTTNKEFSNKEVNNNKRYTITNNGDYVFLYYAYRYQQKMNKEHPTVTGEQLRRMNDLVDDYRAEYAVNNEEWEGAIDEHLKTLPDKNNGNILSFLSGDTDNSPLLRYLNVK